MTVGCVFREGICGLKGDIWETAGTDTAGGATDAVEETYSG